MCDGNATCDVSSCGQLCFWLSDPGGHYQHFSGFLLLLQQADQSAEPAFINQIREVGLYHCLPMAFVHSCCCSVIVEAKIVIGFS